MNSTSTGLWGRKIASREDNHERNGVSQGLEISVRVKESEKEYYAFFQNY